MPLVSYQMTELMLVRHKARIATMWNNKKASVTN